MLWALTASWLAAASLAAACFVIARRLYLQRQELTGLIAALEIFKERTAVRAREMERLAFEDKLTGLRNRRFMDTDLPREFERTRRFGREFTLAILDVDGFKQINDRYSHQTGDRVLAELGALLQRACRTMDAVVRYGGDEFVLYFPETPLPTGRRVCHRVLEHVNNHDWDAIEPGLQVTLTIGLASTRDTDTVDELLQTADTRLLAAKQAGKNRLVDEPVLARVA